MTRRERIVRHSAEELAEMRKRGDTRSDWARAGAASAAEIESQIAADADEAGLKIDWDTVTVELPRPKAAIHMRIDREVLDFFRSTGKGYQTRMNAVLKSYVERMRRSG
jgi:uncharacterized protein (DUF4415 family)